MSGFAIVPERVEAVVEECAQNAPRLEAAFGDEVLATLKQCAEYTNITQLQNIYETAKKVSDDAITPIVGAIKEVGKALEEDLERHRKFNR